MATIDILLATYNGSRFLPDQLASLKAQTYSDWRLLVRDDGSSDSSLQIVQEWAAANGVALEIVRDGGAGLGAAASFGRLLAASDAPYFACCDQDDVWLSTKLDVMLERVREAERLAGPNVPVLAFSDLALVDVRLEPIGRTFWEMARIAPDSGPQSLVQAAQRNRVTGCASLGNAALRALALPIPADARMHDAWLAMVARAFGSLVAIPQQLVRYRLHGENSVGVEDLRSGAIVRGALGKPVRYLQRAIAIRDRGRAQARIFAATFADRLDPDDAELLSRFGQLQEQSWLQRRIFVLRHAIGKGNPMLRLALTIMG